MSEKSAHGVKLQTEDELFCLWATGHVNQPWFSDFQ
jgi:hypothetical protein